MLSREVPPLADSLDQVPDFRQARDLRHPLPSVLPPVTASIVEPIIDAQSVSIVGNVGRGAVGATLGSPSSSSPPGPGRTQGSPLPRDPKQIP
jgi:hypothetical protein